MKSWAKKSYRQDKLNGRKSNEIEVNFPFFFVEKRKFNIDRQMFIKYSFLLLFFTCKFRYISSIFISFGKTWIPKGSDTKCRWIYIAHENFPLLYILRTEWKMVKLFMVQSIFPVENWAFAFCKNHQKALHNDSVSSIHGRPFHLYFGQKREIYSIRLFNIHLCPKYLFLSLSLLLSSSICKWICGTFK